MKIRPLGNRIVVQRSAASSTTPGGIVIPENAKEKSAQGEVIAVGNGTALPDGTVRSLDIKPGDVVLFAKYGGTETNLNGQTYLILDEHDVLGVLT